jgi:hypothetical protein
MSNDDNIIDIESEESPITRGMGRRQARKARQTRARTGDNGEKPTSRIFWIVLGSVITVVTLRAMETYFPKHATATPALPPPPGA